MKFMHTWRTRPGLYKAAFSSFSKAAVRRPREWNRLLGRSRSRGVRQIAVLPSGRLHPTASLTVGTLKDLTDKSAALK